DLGQQQVEGRVDRPDFARLLQPFLRVVQFVGQQSDRAQAKRGNVAERIARGDLGVDFSGFGKLPGFEQCIGSVGAGRWLWIGSANWLCSSNQQAYCDNDVYRVGHGDSVCLSAATVESPESTPTARRPSV